MQSKQKLAVSKVPALKSAEAVPYRGVLQAYSDLALQDFQNNMVKQYGNLNEINRAWGISLQIVNQIGPPRNKDEFFLSGDYKNLIYGKDFIDWYNRSLVNHGSFMLTKVIDAMDNELGDITM